LNKPPNKQEDVIPIPIPIFFSFAFSPFPNPQASLKLSTNTHLFFSSSIAATLPLTLSYCGPTDRMPCLLPRIAPLFAE
jgi:hypothetical protein